MWGRIKLTRFVTVALPASTNKEDLFMEASKSNKERLASQEAKLKKKIYFLPKSQSFQAENDP